MENRKKRSTPVLAMIGVGVVVVIIAAVLTSRGRRDPAVERAMAFMRSDLQGLVMAENTVRRMTGSYVTDPEAAGHLSTLGVNKPLITLAGEGWSATVTHQEFPALQCAVAVGARNPLARFADDGEIVCR